MTALTIRLPDDLYEDLRRAAFDDHRSMNEIVIEVLTEALARRRNKS